MKKLFLMLAVIIAATVNVMAQNHTVTGVVLDAATDEPLVGASVLPVGSSNGVATDMDGKFTLSVPASVKEVTVSYIGYVAVTVPVQPDMTVKLQPSSTVLDQVVVTGYGSAKKLGSVVGSVAVIGDAALESTPATTFVDALAGQVAGLAVYSDSGDPSSTHNTVYIRGVNSLYASTDPLYILDGAPISSALFTTLNPSDIESVTVLKDAASTAIYGSRAANGVIVLTSKKGKFGDKAQVTIRARYGISQLASDKVDMMNSKQYIQFRDIAGIPVDQSIKDLVNNYGIDTNWRDEMFKNAPTYSLEGVVSGGGDKVSYYFSIGHYDQEGIIANSGIRRETLRTSVDSKINDWFRTGIQVNLGYSKSQTNSESDQMYTTGGKNYIQNPAFLARYALPYDSPNYYTIDENGKLIYGEEALYLHYSGLQMPAFIYKRNHEYTTKLTINGTLYEQITPIKGLTLRAQQNVDAFDYRAHSRAYPYETFLTPMGDKVGSNDLGYINPGSVGQLFQRYYTFTYTNTAEYRTSINNVHNIAALVGQESIISNNSSFTGGSSGQTDNRLMLIGNGTSVTMGNVDESISEYVFNSYFFNLNYDYDNRYFFDGTLRRDGSSRFAPDHRWATFGSVGLMWNLKGEKFLQDVAWLDDLKLRYNWGTTGNAGIGNYDWMGLIGAYSYPYAGGTSTGLNSNYPGNPNLTWETVTKNSLGVSVSVFNRLQATVDLYSNKTTDMLMDVPYSFTTGISGATGNICEMTNKGIEVELTGDIYRDKDWYVGARVNFAYNENRISKLFDGSNEYTIPGTTVHYEVGHDPYEFWMVRYVGVDPRDGKQIWLDKDGNETKQFPTDARTFIGKSSNAPWTGGFGVNARWKDISLLVNFGWAAKKYGMNNAAYFTRNSRFATQSNQEVAMLNIWTTPGQVTDIPAYGEALEMDGDNFIEDCSYLRLKSLTLSYSLPKTLLNKIDLSDVKFSFTGRNLFTITPFTGYDPEIAASVMKFWFPNTRQFEFGVEVSF